MRWDKLTIKTQEALSEAVDLASQHGHPEVSTLHLLTALVAQEQGAVASILQRVGVPLEQIASQARARLESLPRVSGAAAQPRMSNDVQAAMDAGWKVAQTMKDEYLSTEHVLLGLL